MQALKSCGEPDCKVNLQVTKPGFFAVAKPDESGNNFYLTIRYSDLDKAIADAIEGCIKLNGGDCRLDSSGAIPGIYKTEGTPSARLSPAVSDRNCRPKTPTLRCSSQCTNGDCTVTYENGCKMRVQVQPQFDSFTNQWTYPAPSC